MCVCVCVCVCVCACVLVSQQMCGLQQKVCDTCRVGQNRTYRNTAYPGLANVKYGLICTIR